MTIELAEYIASYIEEELARGSAITGKTIMNAVDAYEGGAR